jgi:hypothetical protein
MKREGWEQRLRDYINNSRLTEFEWGQNDCCLWVSRYVDSETGTEHAKEWHGRYTTETGALALMGQRGFNCPADIADACLTRKPVAHAGRGDIVSVQGGALGICAGRKSYFLVDGRGLSVLPTASCLAAWEV